MSGFSFFARRDAFNFFNQRAKLLRILITGLTVNAGSLRMAYFHCEVFNIAHVSGRQGVV
jgi:hypothetical protein